MNSKDFLQKRYEAAFAGELEKNAASVAGKIAKKIWSPFGNTKPLAAAAQGRFNTAREAYSSAKSGLTTAKGRVAELTQAQAAQQGKVQSLSTPGFFEKILQGKLGTEQRRIGKMTAAKQEVGNIAQNLQQAGKEVKGAQRQVSQTRKGRWGAMKTYKSERRGISARNLGNAAVRTGIVGTGAYGANQARKRFQTPGVDQQYYQ